MRGNGCDCIGGEADPLIFSVGWVTVHTDQLEARWGLTRHIQVASGMYSKNMVAFHYGGIFKTQGITVLERPSDSKGPKVVGR